MEMVGAEAAPLPFPKTLKLPAPAPTGRVAARLAHGAAVTSLDLFLPLPKSTSTGASSPASPPPRRPTARARSATTRARSPISRNGRRKRWRRAAASRSGRCAPCTARSPPASSPTSPSTTTRKRVVVAAKIVDDDEWRKVHEGVYTGFSQGGRYVKRWPDEDTGLIRYTAEPHEISLVDLPCLPDATFEVVKGGVVEKRAFATPERRDGRGGRASPCRTAPFRSSPRRTSRTPCGTTSEPASGPRSKRTSSRAPRRSAPKAALPEGWRTPEKAASAAPGCSRTSRGALKGRGGARRGCLKTRTRGGRERPPAQGARRRLAGARRSREARRRARGPAAAAQGGAEGGGEERRRRRPSRSAPTSAIRRLAALPPEARALALTKLSLANPLRY